MNILKSKLVHKIVISGLSLIVVLTGLSVINKKLHPLPQINHLAGEVAGMFSNIPLPKFVSIDFALPANAIVSSPYQNVSGDVSISGNVGIGTVTPGATLDVEKRTVNGNDPGLAQIYAYTRVDTASSFARAGDIRAIDGEAYTTTGAGGGSMQDAVGVYGSGARATGSAGYAGIGVKGVGEGWNTIGIGVKGTGHASSGYGGTAIGGYFTASGGNNNYGLIVDQGNVGIGTASPAYTLDINAGGVGSAAVRVKSSDSSYFTGLALNNTATTDKTWIMLANSNGTSYGSAKGFTIREASAGNWFQIATGGAITMPNLAVQGYVCTSTGGVLSAGGGSCATSDARLKTNVTELSSQMDVLGALDKFKGVYFNWDLNNSVNAGQSPDRQVGMIAQDVEQVFPELISYGSDGYRRLDYAKLTGYLVEVAKAQQNEISSLFNIIDVVNKIGRFVQIETQKLIVSGVDILERLNSLSQKVDAQQKEIDSLKAEIEQLKAK